MGDNFCVTGCVWLELSEITPSIPGIDGGQEVLEPSAARTLPILPPGKIWKLDSAWQRNRPNLRILYWQDGQDPALHQPTHHEAMMALRASKTSAAARRCWGSRTSSFRMRHTVLSETRPSLMQEGKRGRLRWVSWAGSRTQDSKPHCVVSAP